MRRGAHGGLRHSDQSIGGNNVSPSGLAWTCQVEPVGSRQHHCIYPGATDDDGFPGIGGGGNCRASASASPREATVNTLRNVLRVLADHDVAATWQRPAYGFEGLAAHYNRLAQSHPLEIAQVFRQVPRQAVVPADHAILGGGHNDGGRTTPRFPPGLDRHRGGDMRMGL